MANRDATFPSIMMLDDTFILVARFLDYYDIKNLRLVNREFAANISVRDNKRYGRACDNMMQWPAGTGLRKPCPNIGKVDRKTLLWCRGDLAGLDVNRHKQEGHQLGFSVCPPCRDETSNRYQIDRGDLAQLTRTLCDTCIGAMGIPQAPIALCTCAEDATDPHADWCWFCRTKAHESFRSDFNVVNGGIQRTRRGPKETIQTIPRAHPPGTPITNTGLNQTCPCGRKVQQPNTVGYGVCIFCFKPRCHATEEGIDDLDVNIPDINIPGPRYYARRALAQRGHKIAHPAVGRRSGRAHATTPVAPPPPFVPPPWQRPPPPTAAQLARFHRRYRPMAKFLIDSNDHAVRSKYWNWQY